MFRRVLLAASGSDRVRQLVVATPPTRRVVDRFVAGERPGDALDVARRLAGAGIAATVARLGEGRAALAAARA
ncbi:proline dehydrogenase, partial [Frankia sp. CNm7]|nr:proline dehydrogenase [Frankia nepalensis]